MAVTGALRFDPEQALQALDLKSVTSDDLAKLVAWINEFVISPANRAFAAKTSEANARGRLTDRINQAFTDLGDVLRRLTGLEERMGVVEDRLTKVEERLTKVEERLDRIDESLKELKTTMMLLIGGSTTLIGVFIAILAAVK